MKKQLWCLLLFLPGLELHAQQYPDVDFTRADARLHIDPYKKEVSGTVSYDFDIHKPVDTVYLDARNMTFEHVVLNGSPAPYSYDGNRLLLTPGFKASSGNRIEITYRAVPEKAMYFTGWDSDTAVRQVWTQGQGRFASNWLPTIDNRNEKVEYDLCLSFLKEYKVLINGRLESVSESDSLKVWCYDMKRPMSSYLLAVAIGKYDKLTEVSGEGIPLESYYYPGDKEKAGHTYEHTSTVFDYLEKEIGVKYPWQNYKQAPVRDFLHAGMENTTLTLFADSFMTDATGVKDRNYLNVNAHEMAHQWFGNLVTAHDDEHHWLQEGFATYYALLAEREVWGEDYYYWKLYRSAEMLAEQSDEGLGEAVTDPGASSLTFYEKGALVLHRLREITGDAAFREAVKQYLQKHAYASVVTSDFLEEAEAASGADLSEFGRIWLKDSIFPEEEIMASLRKNSFINTYMRLEAGDISEEEQNALLGSDIYYPAKQYIISRRNTDSVDVAWNRELFETGNFHIRQALALSLDRIPPELKPEYETLLSDSSYVTVEQSLFRLWRNFRSDAPRYLDQTKHLEGFSDRSLRILWLALAVLTPDYPETAESREVKKAVWRNELIGYTSDNYAYEVRRNAFAIASQTGLFKDKAALRNLVRACVHHTWNFASSSRELLGKLLREQEYADRLRELLPSLGDKEKNYLESVLK
ncbi:M1 family metallopeptidase [Sinomicrobium soli]|uniref:M1 family metallopeptidase n=1 Tax=Sinomicrobium sp. N-1-3-6 TaxID=2219864 RepID=UPI0013751843|nr:M1 family metallopeptidase [Sinomicrobium sp. N-1-3-6]